MSAAEPSPSFDAQGEKEMGRVEAFSDGVLAIAITLLVLEIRVPPHAEGESISLLQQLADIWPSYLAYLVSFTVIGVMWINHHNMFRYIRRTNNAFMFLNNLLLMAITFLNFPTVLMAEYINDPANQQAAALVYSGTMLAIAILYNLLWRYVARNPHLLGKNVNSRAVEGITQSYRYGPLLYLAALLLVFINVPASLLIHFVMAIFFTFTDSSRGFSQLSEA